MQLRLDKSKLSFLALRAGLAATYLYSSLSLISDPSAWVGYLPSWLIGLLPVAPEQYLRFQGVVELLFVVGLLSGRALKIVSALIVFEMVGILAFYGVDFVSFRDMAILGAAASLFFFVSSEEK